LFKIHVIGTLAGTEEDRKEVVLQPLPIVIVLKMDSSSAT